MSKNKKPNPYRNPNRTVLVVGEVDEELAESVMSALLALDHESQDPIVVRITSHGGCISSGFAIFDAITNTRAKVVTEVWGEASSSAALIFQAGDERRVAPNATIMMHLGRGGSDAMRTAAELAQHANGLKRADARYIGIIAYRSDTQAAAVREWCDEERFFNAEEAVALRLADSIIKVP